MSSDLVVASAGFNRDEFGQSGVVVTTDTAIVNGNFTCIQILSDTVFSTFMETGATGGSMTGITHLAGTTIFGKITAYQLTSGAVRAYK